MPKFRLRDRMPGTNERVGPHYHSVKKDGARLITGGVPVYKKIEPGEVLECEEHEIRASLFKWDRLSPEEAPLSETEEPIVGLYIKQTGGGRFNVIKGDTHEVINDEPLLKADALAMVEAEAVIEDGEDEKKKGTTRTK